MTASQQLIKNKKVLNFWNWANSLNNSDYVRLQNHCHNLFGGWVRGVTIQNGVINLNIE